MRSFESDLHRREKQLTELILKNERFDNNLISIRALTPSVDDSGLLSNLIQAPASTSDGIDFNKSAAYNLSQLNDGGATTNGSVAGVANKAGSNHID